jgi:recombination protein RecR
MGPKFVEDLITAFTALPGVGRKTAQRFAFHVLKEPRPEAEALSQAIVRAKEHIFPCPECFFFTEREEQPCDICRDVRRDRQFICLVEEASHVLYLEKDGLLRGTYHVLGGLLSPLEGVRPEDLNIDRLVARVERDNVREVLLALNASAEGDATSEFLSRQLEGRTRVSRLARGLPVGADLDLADRVTLAFALEGRQSV